MRAARILSEGSISNIEVVEELTKPVPKPGEALIRIKAAGVNGSDIAGVRGALKTISRVPRTLGRDYCGTVEEVNDSEALQREWTNLPVWGTSARLGLTQDGTFADYVCVPCDTLTRAPSNVASTMAASLPLPWLCAHIAVDVLAEIQSTDRVLIIGATGAIGSAVCQMLQHRQVSALYGTTRRNTSQQERENGGSDQTHATLIQLKEDLPDQGLVEGVQRASASAASPSPNAGLLDVIIDCSGQEVPVNAALSLLSPGGHSRLIMMATANQTGKFNIDMRTLYMKSVTLKGLSSNVLNGVQVAKALDGVRRGFEEGLYHTGDRSRVDEVELVKGSELLQNALQKSISSGRRLVLTM